VGTFPKHSADSYRSWREEACNQQPVRGSLEGATSRPLDPSGILYQLPLDPSAGVCLVELKVESSIPPGSNFHHFYLTGLGIKGT
jgi:hypothetical protein